MGDTLGTLVALAERGQEGLCPPSAQSQCCHGSPQPSPVPPPCRHGPARPGCPDNPPITPPLPQQPPPHHQRPAEPPPAPAGALSLCPPSVPTHMATRRATAVPKRSKMKPMGKVMKLFMKEPMVKTRENCSSCRLQSAGTPSAGMRGHGDTGMGTASTTGHWDSGDMGMGTAGTTGHGDSGDTGTVETQGTTGHQDSREVGMETGGTQAQEQQGHRTSQGIRTVGTAGVWAWGQWGHGVPQSTRTAGTVGT